MCGVCVCVCVCVSALYVCVFTLAEAGITVSGFVSVNGSRENNFNVLDGIVPTLSGLERNGWARDLTTLQFASGFAAITFDNLNSGEGEIDHIDVVMFNCPEWNIGPDTIEVFGGRNSGSMNSISFPRSSFPVSCDRLVHVCISIRPPSDEDIRSLRVMFTAAPGIERWVHLAEIIINNEEARCPSGLLVPNGEYDDAGDVAL